MTIQIDNEYEKDITVDFKKIIHTVTEAALAHENCPYEAEVSVLLTGNEEIALMKELEAFDTPTVTNAIATYPGRDDCLGLYDPQEIDWYTDDRLRSLFPEL